MNLFIKINKWKFRRNKIVCWKCEKIGHKADKCKLKEKINEICAEEEEIKNKLIALLINDKEQGTEDDYYNDLTR